MPLKRKAGTDTKKRSKTRKVVEILPSLPVVPSAAMDPDIVSTSAPPVLGPLRLTISVTRIVPFIKIIEFLKILLKEVTLIFGWNGLTVLENSRADASGKWCAAINIILSSKDFFEKYDTSKFTGPLRLHILPAQLYDDAYLLKTSVINGFISIRVHENALVLVGEGTDGESIELNPIFSSPLLLSTQNAIQVPDAAEYKITCQLQSTRLQKYVNAAHQKRCQELEFVYSGNHLEMRDGGFRICHAVPLDQQKKCDAALQARFPIEFLKPLVRIHKVTEIVCLMFAANKPLVLEYPLSGVLLSADDTSKLKIWIRSI